MPIYEYECPACKYKFELRQGYNDKESVKCPECGAVVKRLISIPHFTFGWRLTDQCNERFGPRDEYERDV